MSVASHSAASDGQGDSVAEKPNLSELAAKILGQLSVNSWFPAALMAANGAFLAEYATHRSDGLISAAKFPIDKPAGLLVAAVLLLVLCAIVVQAFEIAAIRFLQGDWPTARVWEPVRSVGIWRQRRRFSRLDDRYRRVLKSDWEDVIQRLRGDKKLRLSDRELAVLTSQVLLVPLAAGEPPPSVKELDDCRAIDWRSKTTQYQDAQLVALERRLLRFPRRITSPTALGCVFEVLDDRLRDVGETRVNVVLRVYDSLPPALQSEFASTRSRLDLYSLLTFILLGCGVASVSILLCTEGDDGALLPVLYGSLCWITYQAAIQAARLYCDARIAIQVFLHEKKSTRQDDH